MQIEGTWGQIEIPPGADGSSPRSLYAIPAQLLPNQLAIAKGTDVDQPRNLAKSGGPRMNLNHLYAAAQRIG